jgi:hypothetical protein
MGAYRDSLLLDKTLEIKDKHKCRYFIETGTNDGDSLAILSPYFPELYSCELFPNTYELACRNLHTIKNTYLYNQSSPDFLRFIGKSFENSSETIIFLDAHWGSDCPILEELQIIADHKITGPIIIHDFFVPGENNTAKFNFQKHTDPTTNLEVILNLEYVKDKMKLIYGEFDVYYPKETLSENAGYAIFTKKI